MAPFAVSTWRRAPAGSSTRSTTSGGRGRAAGRVRVGLSRSCGTCTGPDPTGGAPSCTRPSRPPPRLGTGTAPTPTGTGASSRRSTSTVTAGTSPSRAPSGPPRRRGGALRGRPSCPSPPRRRTRAGGPGTGVTCRPHTGRTPAGGRAPPTARSVSGRPTPGA